MDVIVDVDGAGRLAVDVHTPGTHAPDGVTAATVEVGGRAYRTGRTEFVVEDDEPLREDFLLR